MDRPKYPEECPHPCGDSVICDTCSYAFQGKMGLYVEWLENRVKELEKLLIDKPS